MLKENESFDFSELASSAVQPEGIPQLETFNARDGAALAFRHYPSESHVHLILIHGSSAHSPYLDFFAKYLSENNASNVYTPDLRGHGPNPQRRGDISYIEQLEDDLADLISHIKAQANNDAHIIVGGHSSGGGLALRFCGGQYQDQADGLLLLAPFFGHNAPMVKKNSGGWASPSLLKIIALSILNGFGVTRLNGTKVLRFNLPEQYQRGDETLDYSFRLMIGMHPNDYTESLRSSNIPLLIQVGKHDEALFSDKFESGVILYKADAQIALIDDCSHLGITLNKVAMKAAATWIIETFQS